MNKHVIHSHANSSPFLLVFFLFSFSLVPLMDFRWFWLRSMMIGGRSRVWCAHRLKNKALLFRIQVEKSFIMRKLSKIYSLQGPNIVVC